MHAVTDDGILTRPGFVDRAAAILRALGPRGAVHLRGPRLSASRLHDLARAVVSAGEGSEGWVVVNDRVDVAVAAGARAVQLATRSLPVGVVRGFTDLAVGASVHDVAEAGAAAAAGADWVVAGHVYPTPSHAGMPARGLDLVRAVSAVTPRVIAIGGITPDRAAAVAAAGAAGVAAIRGIWDAADPTQAAADYLSSYDAGAADR